MDRRPKALPLITLQEISSGSDTESDERRGNEEDADIQRHIQETCLATTQFAGFKRRVLSPVPASPSSEDSFSWEERPEHSLTNEQYENMMTICTLSKGRSRFGNVYKFLDRKTMKEYAGTKHQRDMSGWSREEKRSFCRDLEEFTTVRHDRIADLYGYHLGKNEVTFFRTFTPSGTVEDKIRQEPLTETVALKYLKQTLEALRFCHNHVPVTIHKNIKASNLLLTISGDIKICDFGVRQCCTEIETSSTTSSPSHFRRSILASAPELLEHLDDETAYTPETDIWATGCLLVEMLTGKPPYSEIYADMIDQKLYEKLVFHNCTDPSNRLNYSASVILQTASPKTAALLNTILVFDVEKRPDVRELLTTQAMSGTGGSLDGRRFSFAMEGRREKEEDEEIQIIESRSGKRELSAEEHKLLQLRAADEWNDEEEKPEGCLSLIRFFLARCMLFLSLLLKWVGMVFLAALSLATVAALVFFSIFVIYNGIGVVCQCHLNEGFIVLIALIMLPILILLTTLCCNNSIEKFKQAKEDGTMEKCKYVYPQPPDNIVLCGVIVVPGSKKTSTHIVRRKKAEENEVHSVLAGLQMTSRFAKGVSDLA